MSNEIFVARLGVERCLQDVAHLCALTHLGGTINPLYARASLSLIGHLGQELRVLQDVIDTLESETQEQ